MTNDRNESPSSGEACEAFEAHLSAYVLGELDVLSDDERAGLEAHLESCERCREEETLLRRTVEAVAQANGAETLDGETVGAAAVLETDRRDAVLGQAAEAVTVSPETVSPETVSPETVSPETVMPKTVMPKTVKNRTAAVASQRVSRGSVVVRRLSWAAAAAVIVACAIPFFIDESVPPRGETAGGVPDGASVAVLRTASEMMPPEKFEEDLVLSREVSEPGPISGAPDAAYILPGPPGVADMSVAYDAGRAGAGAAAVEDERIPTGLFTDVVLSPTPEGESRDASRLGEIEPRRKVVSTRGVAPDADAKTRFGRVYSVDAPVAGTDGIINSVDDRILVAGGGSDGRFAGAEPAAPSAEILPPPNVNTTKPVAETESRRLALESKGRAKDAGAGSTQSGEAAIELGSLSAELKEQAGVSRAPRTPLHYAENKPRWENVSRSARPAGEAARASRLADQAATGRGGRAGEPVSAGATTRSRNDRYLSLSLESAAPSPRESAPTRGRSRELARGEDSLAELSVRGSASGRKKAKSSAAGAKSPSDSKVTPLAATSLVTVVRGDLRRQEAERESQVADGGVKAANETSFGLGRQDALAFDAFSGKQSAEEALRQATPESLREEKVLSEQLAKGEAFKEALNKHKQKGYFYKKYEEATKADPQSQQAQQGQAQQNQKMVELAKLVVDDSVEHAEAADGDQTSPSAATRPVVDAKKLVDEYVRRLAPRSRETPDMMFFRYWGTNPFVEANVDNQSTFAVDVDTASYTLMRKYLTDRGVLPPREAIRTEEFVNYFDYEYAPPAEGQTFAVHTEMAPSPFGHEPEYQLLKVGVKGREVTSEKRKRCALVFVVDTSGSMARESRLELVKDGLRLLVREVDEGDTIGIVAFDRSARTILEPTPADQKERILDAINTLQSRRNTNVDAGLKMGYQMAAANFADRATNRVLLLSDGVANTGVTDVNGMLANVKTQRQRGIFLTCVGVGMGNHNDTLLEQLADRGDGQCVYVDRLEEARKVFVENLAGTLETIARDVKIQVEFDKEKVLRYRLLGYENRAVADSAFRDDTVDAGEVGAGHEVTAVYELKCAPRAEGRIATVRVRHLKVDSREPVELEHVVDTTSRRGAFADTSARFKLGALAGEFAEILRGSYWARGSDPGRVAAMTQDLLGEGGMRLGTDPEVVELAALMHRATPLIQARRKSEGELAQVVDALKENTHLRSRVETLRPKESEENAQYLRNLQQQNEELRRRLERLLDRRVPR